MSSIPKPEDAKYRMIDAQYRNDIIDRGTAKVSMTTREFWVTVHGMVFGGTFLLIYSAGLLGLCSLQQSYLTAAGLCNRLRTLRICTAGMAALAWFTVITGSYIVYPWYRKLPPAGADLTFYPQAFLKAHPLLKEWHFFGMEWKEHVAWLAPIAATAVAFIVWRYGNLIASDARIRRGVATMYSVAFAAGAAAGGLGAMITKAAPLH
jgi:hypothetical protein